MKHILVLWKDEEKCDIYPITTVVDASIGLELMRDPCGALKRHQSNLIEIKWDAAKPAAPAKILAVGSLASMEKKRNCAAACGNMPSSESEDRADMVEQLQATVECLESELRKTKVQLQQTQDCLDSARMVKRLKLILDKADSGEAAEPLAVVSAPKRTCIVLNDHLAKFNTIILKAVRYFQPDTPSGIHL